MPENTKAVGADRRQSARGHAAAPLFVDDRRLYVLPSQLAPLLAVLRIDSLAASYFGGYSFGVYSALSRASDETTERAKVVMALEKEYDAWWLVRCAASRAH